MMLSGASFVTTDAAAITALPPMVTPKGARSHLVAAVAMP